MLRKLIYFKSIIIAVAFTLLPVQLSCSKKSASSEIPAKSIETVDQLNQIIDTGKKMLVLDLYADWCFPCKVIAPVLDSLSQKHKDQIDLFKINVDKSPDIANAFGVQGIPFVIFIQNKTVIHSITGVKAIEDYEKVIKKCSNAESWMDCQNMLNL